jgi:hypothetical protein
MTKTMASLTLKGSSIQIVDGGWSNPILTLKVISFAFSLTKKRKLTKSIFYFTIYNHEIENT